MTRQIWAAIACVLILAISVGGIVLGGDIYDTHSPIYGVVAHFAPKADIDRAEAYSGLVQHQDMDALRQTTSPRIIDANFAPAIARIAGYYPSAQPTAVAPIQYSRSVATGGVNVSTIIINHTYADGTVVLTTTVTDLNTNKVEGFNLRKLTASDLRRLRFDPMHANVTQAVFLAIAVAIFLFTLVTAYNCLATPDIRWKWVWFLFILAGIGSLRFNWLTMVVNVVPIDIHWGAVGYFQLLFEPAMLYINFPLGAVLYWLTKRHLKSTGV